MSLINIEEYIVEKNENIAWYLFCFFFLFFLFVVSFFFYKIEIYREIECIVSEDLLLCPVEYKKVDTILEHNTFYIKKKKYPYKVYSVSEETKKSGNILYKEVALESNIGKRNIDYNVIGIKILIKKENIFLYIKRMIGGIK